MQSSNVATPKQSHVVKVRLVTKREKTGVRAGLRLACDHAFSLYLCNLFSSQRSKEAKKKKKKNTPDLRLVCD